jgi:membrane-bound lytic murein transglycosylase D
MIWKNFALAFLMLVFFTSSDPHFGNDLSWQKFPKEDSSDVKELTWMSTDSFKTYLLDEENKVSDQFPVTNFFYPSVNFWFLIYTQFSSNHVVIHDRDNLSLIYKVLDFSSLHKKGLSNNIVYVLQNKITQERLDELRSHLYFLSENPFSLGKEAKNVYRILKEAKITIPIKKRDRRNFFQRLRANIRTQTGQKNFIKDGIVRSLPYKPFLNKFFSKMGLPTELLAIPFLESSFNPKAESKVGALGAWQFMPLIASYYVPKKSLRPPMDYRANVGVISVAAGHLMKENFQLLKSWDLAVTAYNSGTKHLLKTRRELSPKMKKINLEMIIKNSDSKHFGFASKNFYSEFLALVHALAYEEELFDEIHKNDRHNVDDDLDLYLSKCLIKIESILNSDQLDDINYHNHHLGTTVSFPKATIFASKEALPGSKFLKISLDSMTKSKPKDWSNFLGHQSCSTR